MHKRLTEGDLVKRLGIYFLLCVFGLYVSPGLTAALCVELVALHKDYSHEGHAHEHSGEAAGDEGHHDAAPVDADACCLQIFVGGTDAVTLMAPSSPAKPALSGKVSTPDNLLAPFLPGLLYPSRSLPAHFKTPSEGLQGPLYALFSTYLI